MVFNDEDDRSADVGHPRELSESKDERMSTGDPARATRNEETLRMEPINRRRFLVQGGAAVAAAGVVSAVPLSGAGALAKARGGAVNHADVPADATLDEPVVAHLRNLHTGEVSVFTGYREVIVKDKHLAALLFHATR
jgi:hypothetical protein